MRLQGVGHRQNPRRLPRARENDGRLALAGEPLRFPAQTVQGHPAFLDPAPVPEEKNFSLQCRAYALTGKGFETLERRQGKVS
jgi:hypothetical protein